MQRKNFLISIGADILKKKTNDSRSHVLKSIKDKVVQDADSSEGTGYWTLEAAADYHISIPTVAAAHNFRLASAYHNRRAMVKKAFSSVSTTNQQRSERNVGSDKTLLSYLPGAVYLSFLIAFVQGMHLIAKANKLNHWEVNIKSIIQIWRAGCIIQSDYISDLLAKVCSSPDLDDENLPSHQELASEITKYLTPLKAVVLQAVEADAHVPALSSTLEYVKYISSTDLPTQFMEAELDYFGEHMFDLVDEDNLDAKKGMHHHEWKPAKGIYGT
jgi:6-phosphogluconate dehydrogenase